MKSKMLFSTVFLFLFAFVTNLDCSANQNATNTTTKSRIRSQREKLCSTHMNTYFKSDHTWECSIKIAEEIRLN